MDKEDEDKRFFDPVRGDQFDPDDEVPWSMDTTEATPPPQIEKLYEPEPWP